VKRILKRMTQDHKMKKRYDSSGKPKRDSGVVPREISRCGGAEKIDKVFRSG